MKRFLFAVIGVLFVVVCFCLFGSCLLSFAQFGVSLVIGFGRFWIVWFLFRDGILQWFFGIGFCWVEFLFLSA